MDLNGWLTVITVFTAIIALLPKEDLTIIFQRTKPFEKWIVVFILMVVIPFLIVFPKLVSRWEYLGRLGFTWGFAPENIAFGLFYGCLIWLIILLFIRKPNAKVDNRTIEYFIELLNEKPFEEFFKLFTKYTSEKVVYANWDDFNVLIFQPKFLNKVLEYQPSYLLQFWDKLSNEKDFQSIFKLFLENQNSAYYSEIKEHWNSYSLLDDKPFLRKILKDNLGQSIQMVC